MAELESNPPRVPQNTVVTSEPVRGERAYLYGFKARAQRHHCLGYATFSVRFDRMEGLRKEYSRRVGTITYVPLFIKATALAIQKNPEANAILFKRWFGYQIARFERVDVNLPISRELHGRTITFIATIRDAAAKPLKQIQEELLHYEKGAPEEVFALRRFERLAKMPYWLVQLVHWQMMRSPKFYVRNVGTCGVTFVEGDWYDHFFPIAPTTAVFGIGTVRRGPDVRGDTVGTARVLHCSLMVDNFVVSGPKGGELGRDFKALLEGGEFVSAELAAVSEADGSN